MKSSLKNFGILQIPQSPLADAWVIESGSVLILQDW
jgi:hypothetical protein